MNKKANEKAAQDRRRNRRPRRGYEYQISREQYDELCKSGCDGVIGVMRYLNESCGLLRPSVWLTITE